MLATAGAWPIAQHLWLTNEILLHTSFVTGLKPSMKSKKQLGNANPRCEAIIPEVRVAARTQPDCQ